MSYYTYSFDIKTINSTQEFLFIIKNCLRLISKQNLYDGFFYKRLHLGFCNYKKDFYYTVNSKKSKVYFSDSENFFKNIDLKDTLKDLKIEKRQNRKIEFEFKDNYLYPISLYNCENKKIILAYSDLFEYFNCDNNIRRLNLQVKIENYQQKYSEFVNLVKEKQVFENEKLSSFLFLQKSSSDIRISYKEFEKHYKLKTKPLSSYIFYYTLYFIAIEFNKFLNSTLNYESKSFCVFDKSINKIIKFPNKFYEKIDLNEDEEKKLIPPLLPVSF